jgi:O-antigen/teichoic acid export membrane protein
MRSINQLKDLWSNSPTIRNILRVSFGDATSKVFSLATAFLLIRGLSITDYANYTTFSGISYLLSGIVGVGINMALVRFSVDHLSRGKEKPFALYFLAILFQLIIYTLVAGLCLLFPTQSTALLFGQPALALPLQFGLLTGLGLLLIQFTRTLYQAEEKFNSYIGIIWLIQVVIFLCLAVLWLFHYLSFLPIAIIFSIVQLGIGLWLLANYLGNFEFSGLKNFVLHQKDELKQFLTGSGWLIGYFLTLNLFSRMDVLMLLRFKGKEELAIYGVAFQYYTLSLLFLGSIHAVLLPKFSRADMQQSERQKAFLKQWLQWSAWLSVPIILFDVAGKPLFVWVNGSVYEKSFPIFVIFSFGIWLSMMFSPLVNILISQGDFRFLFFLGIAAFVSNVLLNLLLVPLFGGVGAAATVIISIGIINIASFFKIRSI